MIKKILKNKLTTTSILVIAVIAGIFITATSLGAGIFWFLFLALFTRLSILFIRQENLW